MAKYKNVNDNNSAIITRLENHGIAYWELARELKTHENTIGRWMRNPSDEQKAQLNGAIDAILKRYGVTV